MLFSEWDGNPQRKMQKMWNYATIPEVYNQRFTGGKYKAMV